MNIEKEKKIPFTEHLKELRKRIIICIAAITVGFSFSYFFKDKIFNILIIPLINVMNNKEELIYTGLPEAFFTFIKVSFLSGFIIAFPIIIYQFWLFVVPGLYANEKRLLFFIVLLSSLFFIGGSLFGYFIVFPFAFKFFLSFSSEYIKPLPTLKEYLNFSSRLLIAFGIVFELPILLTFLAKLKIISANFLRKNRKYAILIFFAGAAILTPPDIITQIMMAIPLILLYELSIIGAMIFGKKK